MLVSFVDMISSDPAVSAIIGLAERLQCTPLELLEVGCNFSILAAFCLGAFFIYLLDYLLGWGMKLLEKFFLFLRFCWRNRQKKKDR